MDKISGDIKKEYRERAVLVGVDLSKGNGKEYSEFERSMEELENLAKSCFMEPVAILTQKMESINKGLYIGTGKVKEVQEVAERLEADIIIFDNALTPSQLRNLQDELEEYLHRTRSFRRS